MICIYCCVSQYKFGAEFVSIVVLAVC